MTPPAFTLTNESLTVFHNGQPHIIQKGAPNFLALRNAILTERWDDIEKNLTIAKSLKEWAEGKFTVVGDTVYFEGAALPPDINRRIIELATEGKDPKPIFGFWERLQKNPSFRSVKQLWSFMQHEGIPLTSDGCLLAYKAVRNDYTDFHSGQFNNRPGQVNQMPRNQISDDPQVACHDGFHVGALGYASTFGGSERRIVICKVDPADVVCVPYDSSAQKMRVCKYEVIGHYNGAEMPSTVCATPDEEYPDDEFGDVEDERPDEDQDDGYVDPDDQAAFEHAMDRDETCVPVKAAEPKRKSKKGFAKYDKLDMPGLLKMSLGGLRKYAAKGLLIVGASKIPGGKASLVARILQVRE
jgi:hypothetical protein